MQSAAALLKLLDDPCDAVQSRAARSINCTLQNAIFVSAEMRKRLFDKLMDKYQQFGPNSTRTDKDWGFRPFGEAIRDGFGTDGKNALIDILNGKDTDLAKLSWQILFLQEDYHRAPGSREKMEANYEYYPGHPKHTKLIKRPADHPGVVEHLDDIELIAGTLAIHRRAG